MSTSAVEACQDTIPARSAGEYWCEMTQDPVGGRSGKLSRPTRWRTLNACQSPPWVRLGFARPYTNRLLYPEGQALTQVRVTVPIDAVVTSEKWRSVSARQPANAWSSDWSVWR